MRPKAYLILIPVLLLAMLAGGWAGPYVTGNATWESELQACERLAEKYQAAREVRLSDGCRVDLLSDTEAIEVDWAKKWAESIGQSLYYSIATDRPAGVILLTRSERDDRYVRRCRAVCDRVGIALHLEPAKKTQQTPSQAATKAVAASRPAYQPGDVVAWRSGGALAVGVVSAARSFGGETMYDVVAASGRRLRLPSWMLVAPIGHICRWI